MDKFAHIFVLFQQLEYDLKEMKANKMHAKINFNQRKYKSRKCANLKLITLLLLLPNQKLNSEKLTKVKIN